MKPFIQFIKDNSTYYMNNNMIKKFDRRTIFLPKGLYEKEEIYMYCSFSFNPDLINLFKEVDENGEII